MEIGYFTMPSHPPECGLKEGHDWHPRHEFETNTHSVFVGEARPLLHLRGAFHDVKVVRDSMSLGHIEARELSWSSSS
jgi:hypothetical protein